MARHIEEMRPMPVPISIFSRSSISGVNTTYRNTPNTHNDIVTDRTQINQFALFRIIIYSSFVKSIHFSLQAPAHRTQALRAGYISLLPEDDILVTGCHSVECIKAIDGDLVDLLAHDIG